MRSHLGLTSWRGHAGPTVCRRKLLQACGWHAISIPYFQWNSLASAAAQKTYLRAVLPPAALQACSVAPALPASPVLNPAQTGSAQHQDVTGNVGATVVQPPTKLVALPRPQLGLSRAYSAQQL